MESSEWVLKAILNRFPDDARAQLERFLPKEERERLAALPKAEVNIDLEEPPLIDRIHWSWLLPELKEKPLKEQKLFLGALPHATSENLCRELKIKTVPEGKVNKILEEFVLQTFLQHLAGDQLLPAYFLPPSPISDLLSLDKHKLISLIDTLALTDLAAELRQIVETKILKKIYSFLSEDEMKYLKKAAAVQQPTFTRLDLKNWDGTEKSLRTSLHKRGLARLGHALSSQHPDFTWYVCHQLDIGRGTALAKLGRAETAPGVSAQIVHQIEELMKGLK